MRRRGKSDQRSLRDLQRFGPNNPAIHKSLREIDGVCAGLIAFFERHDVAPLILSEYGITRVSTPIHINRVLRSQGLIAFRHGSGAGAGSAPSNSVSPGASVRHSSMDRRSRATHGSR